MKRTIVAAAIVALVVGGVGAFARYKPKDDTARCVVPKGAYTVVANADARVYARDKGYRNNAFLTGVYACRYSTGRKVALGTARVIDDENESGTPVRYIRDVSLSDEGGDEPPGVAYVDTNCVGHPCTETVVVRSLRRKGKTTVWRLRAGGPFDQLALSAPTDQDGLALAWLETSAGGDCEDGCKVHLVKRSGDKILGAGKDIDSEVFGELDDDQPGIITSLGSNSFIWKRGNVIKLASFND